MSKAKLLSVGLLLVPVGCRPAPPLDAPERPSVHSEFSPEQIERARRKFEGIPESPDRVEEASRRLSEAMRQQVEASGGPGVRAGRLELPEGPPKSLGRKLIEEFGDQLKEPGDPAEEPSGPPSPDSGSTEAHQVLPSVEPPHCLPPDTP